MTKTVKPLPFAQAVKVALIGQTVRCLLAKTDLALFDQLTGYHEDSDSFVGNRSEESTGAYDLERLIPTLAAYDPDLGRLSLCGWGSGTTALGDGGHRGRRLRRLLLADELGQSATVDFLFSDRAPHMGGFDQCGIIRKPKHEDEVLYGADGWANWRSQCGNIIRLRTQGDSPKGGSRRARMWNGIELSANEQASQWGSKGPFVYVWNLLATKSPKGMHSLEETFSALALLDCGWKTERDSQLLVCSILDVVGDYDDTLRIVDTLNHSLDKFAAAWKGLQIRKPDVNAKYSALCGWVTCLRDGKLPRMGSGPITTRGLFDLFSESPAE